MYYYPICLDIRGKDCLVVGGGAVGLDKTRPLLRAGARVAVVSLSFVPEFDALPDVERRRRAFEDRDLDGVFLAIAATNDAGFNRRFAARCAERGVLFNVVDVPDLCQFIVPAVVDRGNLAVSIYTQGAAPALSGRLRRELEAWLPADTEAYVAFLQHARGCAKRVLTSMKQRFAFGRYLASREGYERWRALDEDERRKWVEQLLAEYKEGRPR